MVEILLKNLTGSLNIGLKEKSFGISRYLLIHSQLSIVFRDGI